VAKSWKKWKIVGKRLEKVANSCKKWKKTGKSEK
jgi:hypothetical protein